MFKAIFIDYVDCIFRQFYSVLNELFYWEEIRFEYFFFQLIENSFLFLFFSSNTLFELTRCHCESSAVLECYVWMLICFDL